MSKYLDNRAVAEEDDVQKFEKLFDKLIRENKIDRLDLMRRIQSKEGAMQLIGTNI